MEGSRVEDERGMGEVPLFVHPGEEEIVERTHCCLFLPNEGEQKWMDTDLQFLVTMT